MFLTSGHPESGGRFDLKYAGTQMFNVIKNRWDGARAKQLAKELDDCMARLELSTIPFRKTVILHFNETLENLESYRPIDSYSNKDKKHAAKRLLKTAQQSYANDAARGHGLFLLSAYIESMALPGPDAVYVHTAVQAIIDGQSE